MSFRINADLYLHVKVNSLIKNYILHIEIQCNKKNRYREGIKQLFQTTAMDNDNFDETQIWIYSTTRYPIRTVSLTHNLPKNLIYIFL